MPLASRNMPLGSFCGFVRECAQAEVGLCAFGGWRCYSSWKPAPQIKLREKLMMIGSDSVLGLYRLTIKSIGGL